VQESMTQVGLP